MRVVWILLGTFWPVVAATVWVIANDTGKSDYWSAAPWVIVIALFAAPVTFALSLIASNITRRSESIAAGGMVYLGGLALLWLLSLIIG